MPKEVENWFQTIENNLSVDLTAMIWNIGKIILILLVGRLFVVLLQRLVKRILKKTAEKNRLSSFSQRIDTFQSVICSVIKYVIYFFVITSILGVLGLSATVSSLLATAGIGGVAIAFGAQGLVKDIITGLFLLFEDQFTVGETVQIDGEKGVIEAITLRSTRIRKPSGEITTVPNGSITKVTNFSRATKTNAALPGEYEQKEDDK